MSYVQFAWTFATLRNGLYSTRPPPPPKKTLLYIIELVMYVLSRVAGCVEAVSDVFNAAVAMLTAIPNLSMSNTSQFFNWSSRTAQEPFNWTFHYICSYWTQPRQRMRVWKGKLNRKRDSQRESWPEYSSEAVRKGGLKQQANLSLQAL